jgi:hypothetical protein
MFLSLGRDLSRRATVGLDGGDCDGVHDVVHQSAAGQIVDRLGEALQHGPDCHRPGGALDRLVDVIAADHDDGVALPGKLVIGRNDLAQRHLGIVLEPLVGHSHTLARVVRCGGSVFEQQLKQVVDFFSGSNNRTAHADTGRGRGQQAQRDGGPTGSALGGCDIDAGHARRRDKRRCTQRVGAGLRFDHGNSLGRSPVIRRVDFRCAHRRIDSRVHAHRPPGVWLQPIAYQGGFTCRGRR